MQIKQIFLVEERTFLCFGKTKPELVKKIVTFLGVLSFIMQTYMSERQIGKIGERYTNEAMVS